MLSKTTRWLADHSYHVSVVARDSRKMERLINQSNQPSNITPLLVDYSNTLKLKCSIDSTIGKNGPIDLVIAWIHSYAEHALHTISQIVSKDSEQWKLVHILGSSSDLEVVKNRVTIGENCSYHQVQLGFKIENSQSRWLTNDEIADGVIEMLKGEIPVAVVIGQMDPWEEHR